MDNIDEHKLINNLNQIIMNQLTQKILFATSVIIFIGGLVSLVVYNAIHHGIAICLGF